VKKDEKMAATKGVKKVVKTVAYLAVLKVDWSADLSVGNLVVRKVVL
jgi:hypothetical protein